MYVFFNISDKKRSLQLGSLVNLFRVFTRLIYTVGWVTSKVIIVKDLKRSELTRTAITHFDEYFAIEV